MRTSFAILTQWHIGIILPIVIRREVNVAPAGFIIAEEIDVDLLPIPNDVFDDYPEGQPFLLHRHIVHGVRKGAQHIPQEVKGLGLQVLLLEDLLQLLDVFLDALVPLGTLVDAVQDALLPGGPGHLSQ